MGIDTGLDTAESSPVAMGLPSLEREAGIEPASLAWKAKVLPLNYSRPIPSRRLGGGGWIRTSVGVSQQIYSLPPLATRAPLLSEPLIMPDFFRVPQLSKIAACNFRHGDHTRAIRHDQTLPRQRGNVSLSNLQVVNAILYVAEHDYESSCRVLDTRVLEIGPHTLGVASMKAMCSLAAACSLAFVRTGTTVPMACLRSAFRRSSVFSSGL